MRKYCLLPILALFAFCFNLDAASILQTDAQQVALNFYNIKTKDNPSHITPFANLVYYQTDVDGRVVFYVFDMKPAKGFVIVSAEDNVIPVLGYSTESNFKMDFSHIGLNHWMKKTAANIHLALVNNTRADERITNQWNAYKAGINPQAEKSNTVAPLVTTTWDQENDISNPPPFIYNLLCPWNSVDNQRCLTGCVATAQAQVMKYWNYPAVGMGSFSYADNVSNGYSYNYGTLSSNFAAHTYQWQLMPSVLTGNEPLAQDSAIDVLMYDCCVSVGMDFGDDNQDGSGAEALLSLELPYDSFCSQYALGKYFAYNWDTMQGVIEANYSAAAWTALIEHEMNVGRPVIYEGDDASQGGHAWVCDGYDANNNLHMNWGWSGFDNGYFAINNLTTSGNFNPVQDDDALIGIMPKYPRAPITNFGATLTNSCTGTVQFADFSQDLPTSWSWDFGDGATSTQQNPVHSYATNGTYTVTLTATNPAGSTPKTLSNYVTVNMLTAPTVTNVSAAAPQSFSLSATTANTVAWYDASGTLLSTSNPFVTPVINSTTTYFVQDSVVSPTTHVGAANKQIGNGGYVTDPYAVQFNVLSPCVIQSVYVYAQNAAYRNFQVIDSTGHTIAQSSVFCPAGGSMALINLKLDAGGPYFMQVGDTLGLYSNSVGGNYPYSDSLGLVTITGNTAFSSAAYYYFYNWVVKAPDCVSPRVSVTASITTGINNLADAITFNMFPNPAANDLVLQTTETGSDLVWSLKNILGQTVITKNADATQTHINLSNMANGIYLVELRAGEKSAVKKLVISR